MIRRTRPYLIFGLALCGFALMGAPGVAAVDSGEGMADNGGIRTPDRTIEWGVFRDGDKIGEHRIVLRQENGDLIVDDTIDIHVEFAFVTVYRYEHHSNEVWHEGALLRVTSQTNDDGKKNQLQAQAQPGGALAVKGSGGDFTAPAGTLPSSLWRISMTDANRLLDLQSGELLSVQFSKKQSEVIDVAGRKINAEHVTVAGDLSRDMWYDGDGLLVKQNFLAPDGSKIDYRLDAE